MQAAAAADEAHPTIVADIQRNLEDEAATELFIRHQPPPWFPRCLAATDIRRIVACLRENTRFHTLHISYYLLRDMAALKELRNGLLQCPSVKTVNLCWGKLTNEGLACLLPAFYNTSVTELNLTQNDIQGGSGGELIRDLLVGNNTLLQLLLGENPIGPDGVIEVGKGIVGNKNRLRGLNLVKCRLGNKGLENLVVSLGDDETTRNSSITHLSLGITDIQGAEGGRQVALLVERLAALKRIRLFSCLLGSLGACGLAPALAAATHLECLMLIDCRLGNEGVKNLVPVGHVNRTLTRVQLGEDKTIRGVEGGENIIALASRCLNLDSLEVDDHVLTTEQRRRLNLVLDRKRLYTEAKALGGSPASVILEKLIQANAHEYGLSAVFVILRDYIFAEQQQQKSAANTTSWRQERTCTIL